MTYEQKYLEMEQNFMEGKITVDEWTVDEWKDFCTLFLDLILDDNKDILKRLKGEW